jgi:hypothetical protein
MSSGEENRDGCRDFALASVREAWLAKRWFDRLESAATTSRSRREVGGTSDSGGDGGDGGHSGLCANVKIQANLVKERRRRRGAKVTILTYVIASRSAGKHSPVGEPTGVHADSHPSSSKISTPLGVDEIKPNTK